VVQVTLTPTDTPPSTVSSSPLVGTSAASTGTANVALPTGMSVLSATATIDLMIASARPMFIDGERVNRMEIAAVYTTMGQECSRKVYEATRAVRIVCLEGQRFVDYRKYMRQILAMPRRQNRLGRDVDGTRLESDFPSWANSDQLVRHYVRARISCRLVVSAALGAER
jgi:hypothetical protein